MVEHMFDPERQIEAGAVPPKTIADQHELLLTPDREMAWAKHKERIARFDRMVREENRRRLELLDEIALADADEFWHDDAAPSMVEWLRYRYRMSRSTARRLVRTANAIREMPRLREAFSGGLLSWDQLDAAVTAADEVDHPDPDGFLAVMAPDLTPQEIRALVTPKRSDDSDPSSVAGIADRWVRYHFSETEPVMKMQVQLPDIEGAALMTALSRRADRRDLDPTTGEFLPHETALADALVEVASQALADDTDHDRATVLVSTSVETLLGTSEDPARIVDGPLLSNPTLRRLTCDARIQLALQDPQDGTVGVGRTTRTIPPWLARVVRARDGGCRFPDCDRTRWVQIHHLVHWTHGGPTDLDNLITLCGFHHRLVHHSGWSISGDPERAVTWIAPWGEPYHRLRSTIVGVEAAREIRKAAREIRPPERRS